MRKDKTFANALSDDGTDEDATAFVKEELSIDELKKRSRRDFSEEPAHCYSEYYAEVIGRTAARLIAEGVKDSDLVDSIISCHGYDSARFKQWWGMNLHEIRRGIVAARMIQAAGHNRG